MAQRIELFKINPANPMLHDHALKGTKLGLRAFAVTGDVRIVYKLEPSECVTFLDIGTHNQVY